MVEQRIFWMNVNYGEIECEIERNLDETSFENFSDIKHFLIDLTDRPQYIVHIF